MSKVKRITVKNIKAVSDKTIEFNGCTAIITGRNNSGKTTFLRSLFDRCRGYAPEEVLKEGEVKGFSECELTTGEKLKWELTDNGETVKEKLSYITDKDVRQPLTMELRKKFLPDVFDVDKFLNSPPKQQRETLQKIVGLDFTDVDNRYKQAYQDREDKNREFDRLHILFTNTQKPEEVHEVSLSELAAKKSEIRTTLNNLYLQNKEQNNKARKEWENACDEVRKNVDIHNKMQEEKAVIWSAAKNALEKLISFGYKGSEAGMFVMALEQEIEEDKKYEPVVEPEYINEMPDDTELQEIDKKINEVNETNRKAIAWKSYLEQEALYKEAGEKASAADNKVKEIEKERMDMIKKANLPAGFNFTDYGITYNNLPFTKEQLSSSGIYIAALKLAATTLGEIKTLHFDASFLDKNSLLQIEQWAETEDLQLLIERPDFDGGEITYELLNC